MACLTGERRPGSSKESFETGDEQFEGSHCGASKGKKIQKNFVKRNIKVCQSSRWARRSDGVYRMT